MGHVGQRVIVNKGIPEQCAVLGVTESYHGLTSGVWNLQDKSRKREGLSIILHFGFAFLFSRRVGVGLLLTGWVCRIWTSQQNAIAISIPRPRSL